MNCKRMFEKYQNKKCEYAANPTVISARYPTEDVIIADFIAADEFFGADPSGASDSRSAIQKALDICAENGGGTVWLPAGKYRVTGAIKIHPFVTLRGDWQDPDTGSDYGTIILADVEEGSGLESSLFTVGGSAGAVGLTVYYPNQDINNVKEYPFTFYVHGKLDSNMLQSVQNCTVINGYRGIGCCVDGKNAHEMLTVENFKGTFLCTAVEAYNQSDVGTWKNVCVSGKYWAECGAGLKCADRKSIDEYTRANTDGLILGDLEWTEFENLRVEDCKNGIRVVKGKRIEFAGSLYDVTVKRCGTGIKIESFDTRWGMTAANSFIEGEECALLKEPAKGVVKTCKVDFKGNMDESAVIKTDDKNTLSSFSVDSQRTPFKPEAQLFVFHGDKKGKSDISSKLQKMLDEAFAAGGGVVYIPAGIYCMKNNVTVPGGVELRGCSSVPTRDQSGNSSGTVIAVYYGYDAENPDTASALVTLRGHGAGVRGIRFIYPENNPAFPGREGTARKCSYCIRGVGKEVYAVNVSVSAAYNGIDFSGCHNHFIKKFVSCCYNNAIRVSKSRGGMIEGCLQNGSVLVRNGLKGILTEFDRWITEGEVFDIAYNPLLRKQCTYLIIENCEDETVLNTFAYGVKTFVQASESENTFLCNVGCDNVGDGSPMIKTCGGSFTGVNIMRWNGISYENNGSQLSLLSRLTIDEALEKNVFKYQ